MRMQIHNLEQNSYNQNHAKEREIGLLAKYCRRRITNKVISKCLWYFGLVYEAELLWRMSIVKDKWNGYEEVKGQTPDIGEYLDC